MCIKCHSGLDDTSVLNDLNNSLKKSDLSGWNETSISHIILAYIGINGKEASKSAEKLMLKYIRWKKCNPKQHDGSFFGEPTVEFVEDARKEADILREKLSEKGITSEQLKHVFFSQDNQDTSSDI